MRYMMMSSRVVLLLLWLLSSAFSPLCDGIINPDVVCSEKEKRALLSFKHGLSWDPSNRLSSWSEGLQQDCCTWPGVRCNNLTGRVIELHLRNPYPFNPVDYESYKTHQLGGKISPSLVELEYLSYLDLSFNNFTVASIPSFLGSMGSLRYLNLSYVFFEGSIPHQLGNLSGLHVLDLSYNNQLYVDNLGWIGGLQSLEYLDLSYINLHKAVDWHRQVSKLPSLSELRLSECNLEGPISHQLGNLSSLHHLDLSYNHQLYVDNLSWIGGLQSLKYLDLTEIDLHKAVDWHRQVSKLPSLSELRLHWCNLEGPISHQLGNLSSLHLLDLRFNDQLYVDDLSWIAGLHSLEYLDMTWIDLHMAVDWFQAVSMLPSLSQLHLSQCKLEKMIPPLSYVNFTSLKYLDLSSNHFNCKIPHLLFNFTNLVSLRLYDTSLYGHIPSTISDLRLLTNLDLGKNLITGQIPDRLGKLKHLEYLSLSQNSLYGPIPASIGNLSALIELDLSNNQLNGIVSELNFAKLSKLKTLYMSSNYLLFNVSSNWVPPFQLGTLEMSSCKMGPRFPSWLRTQTSLHYLDISQSGISGTAPEWFWKWVSGIDYIDISDNQINGDISYVLLNSGIVQMTSNGFKGQLPRLSPNVRMLNLANNSFFGPISPFLCQEKNRESQLMVLDLSDNNLSGELSHCLMHWQYLENLNLGSNHLSGKIPNSMGSLTALQTLQLHNNNFFGKMPSSLRNCTNLRFINLAENEFTGLIPSWIREMLNLEILFLRSNQFITNIPSHICQLSKLKILNLGNNNLSGPIPKCWKNISAMTITNSSDDDYAFQTFVTSYNFFEEYINILSLVTKGRELEYKNNLKFVRSIDFSSNNISGSIPEEFFSLHALQFLNLSGNQITGKISKNIGGMTMLESLDLSRNHLLSEIPQSMTNLTFLSYLNLSYNNFSGRIPSGTQLQSFNASSYIGNAQLCGAPLNNSCIREDESQGRGVTSMEKEEEMVWFYIGMGPGFVVGFWIVLGTLLLKRAWRHAYFQLLDDMKDRIYLAILLKVNWLHRKFKKSNDA